MIKHIVMWKLKDEAEGADKLSNAREMKPVSYTHLRAHET